MPAGISDIWTQPRASGSRRRSRGARQCRHEDVRRDRDCGDDRAGQSSAQAEAQAKGETPHDPDRRSSPLDADIALDVSEAVYPLDVQRGKLSQEACDKEIAMMAAVLKTLEWCERNKPLIVELRKAERRRHDT